MCFSANVKPAMAQSAPQVTPPAQAADQGLGANDAAAQQRRRAAAAAGMRATNVTGGLMGKTAATTNQGLLG